MPDISSVIDRAFRSAIASVDSATGALADPQVKPSANPAFGDYQANFAMALGKRLGRPPRDVANEVVAALDFSSFADRVDVAGPGFVNVRLSRPFLEASLATMAADDALGVEKARRPDRVVVDYSSPNVAKEMHIGHVRSTLIGDAICRILEFRGHEVVRQNHLGDWGTQFGMLIEHMLDRGWSVDGEKVSPPEGAGDAGISDLNLLYRESKAKFDSDPSFAERARARVVRLQSGDPGTLALWRELIEESKKHFRAAYRRLGVLLDDGDYRGESFYNPLLPSIAGELESRGLARVSDGALCAFPEGFKGSDGEPLPLIVRKADGGYGYDATDLAALRYRVEELGGTRLVYLTDGRQQLHFSMVFAACREAGWLPEGTRAEHVWFGSILGEDGKPFKTRSGEYVLLSDVLDEAESRAFALVTGKNPDLDEATRREVARAVGFGAIKYADLSSDRVKDYVFSWDRMMAFDGNTAPYLQNAYVRIRGIFRKAAESGVAPGPFAVEEDAERALALELLRFGAAVESVERDLAPHKLCTWLYGLASTYHAFYERCPVLSAPPEARSSRLALSDLVARTLAKGLELLGISVVERM